MLSAIEEGSEEGSQETWHHTKRTETKSVSHESPSEAKSEEAQMLFEMKVLDEFIDAIHMAGLSEDQAHKMVDIATRKNGHVDTEVIAEMLVELRTDNSTKEPKDDGESKELITPDKLIVEVEVAGVSSMLLTMMTVKMFQTTSHCAILGLPQTVRIKRKATWCPRW